MADMLYCHKEYSAWDAACVLYNDIIRPVRLTFSMWLNNVAINIKSMRACQCVLLLCLAIKFYRDPLLFTSISLYSNFLILNSTLMVSK